MANASQTKADLIAEAETLGVDVEALPHDEGKDPTNQAIADAINARQEALAAAAEELPVTAELFLAAEPALTVPFAGLLAAEPNLQVEELPPSKWRGALDKYLKSDRP